MKNTELIAAGLICASYFNARSDARIVEATNAQSHVLAFHDIEPSYAAFIAKNMNVMPHRIKERRYVVDLKHFANRNGAHFYAGYCVEENTLVVYLPRQLARTNNVSRR